MALGPLIPHAQIIHHSRKKSTFRNTQKEPCNDEAREIGSYSEQSRNGAPDEHKGRKPELGSCAFEDYVAGDFKEDVANEVDGES